VREGVRERPRSANAHREAQVAELRAREKERAERAQEVRCLNRSLLDCEGIYLLWQGGRRITLRRGR